MTREIKLKAWNKTGNYMVTSAVSLGNIIKDKLKKGSSGHYNSYFADVADSANKQGEEYELLMWTGSYDEKGEEIYEPVTIISSE